MKHYNKEFLNKYLTHTHTRAYFFSLIIIVDYYCNGVHTHVNRVYERKRGSHARTRSKCRALICEKRMDILKIFESIFLRIFVIVYQFFERILVLSIRDSIVLNNFEVI